MRVFESSQFKNNIHKVLSQEQVRQLHRLYTRIQPRHGKRIGPSWLREVKIQSKRVFYAVQADVALFLSVSDKKSQQHVIDRIREKSNSILDLLNQLA